MSIQLSPNFSVEEFEMSQWGKRHGKLNKMTERDRRCAERLCKYILEPIREHFKSPVIITSGFRSPTVNEGVGGSPSSQHKRAEAADIRVVGHTPFEVASWVAYDSGLDFDQCIHEHNSWVHISYTERYKNRKDILTISRDGTKVGIL